ncbi:MAG: lipoprotein-releasing ABC transporter permease subunit [Betaproteobacteria bacterium]|nr:lipoprotein-releasing ABC transporter permease subunit [Betaproteobacteria bacterium]
MRYELLVGLRYTRAKRRNRFISFISLTSMAGMALGVAALIVVLSVMNGFQEVMRTRILGVVSNVQISGVDNRLADWQSVLATAARQPHVVGAAPFVQGEAMLTFGERVRGAIVRGILPARESEVTDIASHMRLGILAALRPGGWGIVLGVDLARALGVLPGDKVVLIVPQGQVTPAGVIPRLKQFTVVGIFDVGEYEFDSGLALIDLQDAQTLYRTGDAVSGIRLKLDDIFRARQVADSLLDRLGSGVYATDWTRSHSNYFRAVEIEKHVMFVILTLIVAVAAFNIVSTLVMLVTDKQADIAILRTLGASPGSVMQIFVVQGAVIGIVGTLLGVLAGIVIALNIGTIVPAIEHLFHVQFLAKDVYYISELPSHLKASDVLTIATVSLVLSFLATLYPSWRASRVNPAEALRYE